MVARRDRETRVVGSEIWDEGLARYERALKEIAGLAIDTVATVNAERVRRSRADGLDE